jgi:hypothetical protein
MKMFLTALALAALMTIQPFDPAAAAPNNERGYGQQKNACMYEGYPCDQWKHSGEDMW